MKYIFHLLLITLMGCAVTSQKETDQLSHFVVPQIKVEQPKDSVSYFEADSLDETMSIFGGKYSFAKEIEFRSVFDRDTSINEDMIWEYNPMKNETGGATDGFQIQVDYNTEIPNVRPWFKGGLKYYYPVFIYNETRLDKMFNGKAGAYLIQEALDSHQVWRPIEMRAFEFCGVGSWGMKVHSGEFVSVLVPKYNGNYKTKIRVRLKIGATVYVSESFDGSINYSQFYLKNFLKQTLIEDPLMICSNYFYGSIPLGFDKLPGSDFTKLN